MFRSGLALLFACILLAIGPAGVARAAPQVTDIRLGVHPGKVRVVVDLNTKLAARTFALANPYRVVLDLPEVDFRIGPTRGEQKAGFVTGFRFGRFSAGHSRVVVDLDRPGVVGDSFMLPPRDGHSWRLVLDIRHATEAEVEKATTKPEKVANAPLFVPPKPAVEKPEAPGKHHRRVVVIDPGHGGVDPGTIGRDGVYEKTITLAEGKALRNVLRRRGRYKVVMTRTTDVFIRLRQRVAIARAAGADLFISLHVNSIHNRRIRGASVYTLSETASDKEAAALAAKENRADLIGGVDLTGESDDVTNILIDLAQRETMNESARFARILVHDLRKATRLLPKTHRFAGFAVLKAPDVPSVLIEMGYLSNTRDESELLRPRYRARFARAIANAIDAFFAARERAER